LLLAVAVTIIFVIYLIALFAEFAPAISLRDLAGR